MSFEYPYTCPTIDANISSAKDEIQNFLDDVVCDLNPMFYSANDGKDKDLHIEGLRDSLYDTLEYVFEGARSSNEDMRKSAETQVENAEEEVENLTTEIEDMKAEIRDLESQIDDLNSQIEAHPVV